MKSRERDLQKLYEKLCYQLYGEQGRRGREELLSYRFQTQYDVQKNYTIMTLKVLEKESGFLRDTLIRIVDKKGREIATQKDVDDTFFMLDDENIYEVKVIPGDDHLQIVHFYYHPAQEKFLSKIIYTNPSWTGFKTKIGFCQVNKNLILIEDVMAKYNYYEMDPNLLYNQTTHEVITTYHESRLENSPYLELYKYVYHRGEKSILHFFVDEVGNPVEGVVDTTRGKFYPVKGDGVASLKYIYDAAEQDLAAEIQRKETIKKNTIEYNHRILARIKK